MMMRRSEACNDDEVAVGAGARIGSMRLEPARHNIFTSIGHYCIEYYDSPVTMI